MVVMGKLDQDNEADLFGNILGENTRNTFWVMDSAILSFNFRIASNPVFWLLARKGSSAPILGHQEIAETGLE